MPRAQPLTLPFATVQLAGIPYAILPAAALIAACRKAGIHATPLPPPVPFNPAPPLTPDPLDATHLAQRIADRRQAAGLTQAQLARRAGVRVETVNRIERGHVTPDFRTIRKLVQAMSHAESAPPAPPIPASRKPKEKPHVHD